MSKYEILTLVISGVVGLFSVAGAIVSWIEKGKAKTEANKAEKIAKEIKEKVINYNNALDYRIILAKCREISSILSKWIYEERSNGKETKNTCIKIQEFVNLLLEYKSLFEQDKFSIEKDINFLRDNITKLDKPANVVDKDDIRALLNHISEISDNINLKIRNSFKDIYK